MKTPGLNIDTATTLKLFVVSAVVVIAMLCSLAVFGLQKGRSAEVVGFGQSQSSPAETSYLQQQINPTSIVN